MLRIITSNPIVTMMSSVKLNQPMTMAEVPTPDNTLPFPKSWAMMLAATDAVCCHSTDTSTKMEAMKMMARAIWLTGRLGKGLTSRSEPSLSSSSCQPGNVARSSRQMKAKMMAMILQELASVRKMSKGWECLQEVGKHNHVLELTREPDQVQGVLVYRNLVGQRRGIVTTKPRAAIGVDADAKVPHSCLQPRVADNVADGRVDVVVDLRGVGDGRVFLVVEGEQEDVGDERRG